MKKDLLIALNVSLLTLVLTGGLYPLLVTGTSSLLFPHQASGSLIQDEMGKVIGSKLLSQKFSNPAYFFPRPAAENKGYNGIASGGSNLASTSKILILQIQERISFIKEINSAPIPLDLVTTSASGFDPHISIDAALWQAPQVAIHRKIPLKQVITLINSMKELPLFYILGEPRVNVLMLNLALDHSVGSPEAMP